MNGKFELDVIHRVEESLKKDIGYLGTNPIVLELTRLCLEYKKKPEEVVKIFKEVQRRFFE